MTDLRRLAEISIEQNRRAREGVRVYTPYEQQEPIHSSTAIELLVSGGKRSGKSVSVAMEFASRVTGIPIKDSTGKVFKPRWPIANENYPRIYWVIGYDLNHIGQTIHRLLFQPGMGGQFRCIRDEKTGLWRAFNRADKSDAARIGESDLTEPLIPHRMIVEDSWEWEDKRGNKFKSVQLTNGAKIYAYPSTSPQPKMGDAVSGIWIDEDVAFSEHVKEWQDRLTDENGWLLWSVWPHMKNPALISLIERAELCSIQENPRIQRVQLIMSKNPFISQENKEASLERMGSEEEIARRDRGEVNMDAYSMYTFDNHVHCLRRKNDAHIYEPARSNAYLKLRSIYELLGELPNDWTRYLIMDPSHTRTGIQSWAIPPHEIDGVFVGNVMICEWELVCKRMTAEAIAQAISNRRGSKHYECHIIDNRAGRQTHAGRDTNTRMHFSMAFRGAGLVSRQTSYDFMPGCDVPTTRYRAVRNLMEPVAGVGIPSLMIIDDKCPETKREFTKYMKKRDSRVVDSDAVLDEPANPRLYDLMACTEYAAAHMEQLFIEGTAYVEPTLYRRQGSSAYRKAMQLIRGQTEEQGVVTLGAGV